MDLVDIDKALDDLELHQEHEKQLEEEEQQQQQRQQLLLHQQQTATVAVVPHITIAPATTITTTTTTSVTTDKEFRSNVSTVFHSLNEYVNCGTVDDQQQQPGATATTTLARLDRYEPITEDITPEDRVINDDNTTKDDQQQPPPTLNDVTVNRPMNDDDEPMPSSSSSSSEDDGSSGSPLITSSATAQRPRRPLPDNADEEENEDDGGEPFDDASNSSSNSSSTTTSEDIGSLAVVSSTSAATSSSDDDIRPVAGLATTGFLQYRSQMDEDEDGHHQNHHQPLDNEDDDENEHSPSDEEAVTVSASLSEVQQPADKQVETEQKNHSQPEVTVVGFAATTDDASDTELENYLLELELESGGGGGGHVDGATGGGGGGGDGLSQASTVEFGPHDGDGGDDNVALAEETPSPEEPAVFTESTVEAPAAQQPKPPAVVRLSSGEYEPECPSGSSSSNNNNNEANQNTNYNQHQAIEMPVQAKKTGATKKTKKAAMEAVSEDPDPDRLMNVYEALADARTSKPLTKAAPAAPIVASVSPVDQVPEQRAPSPPHPPVKPTTLHFYGPSTAPEPFDSTTVTPESADTAAATNTTTTTTPPDTIAPATSTTTTTPPTTDTDLHGDAQLTTSSSDEFEPPSYVSISNMSTPQSGDIPATAADNAPPPPLPPPPPPPQSAPPIHNHQLGSIPPYWIPDAEATTCMLCQVRFSLIKRRHHCRCCGLVLCSGCCSLKAKLAYMGGEQEARVCVQCDIQLAAQVARAHEIGQEAEPMVAPSLPGRPNPNNPMEYCSQISPLLQPGGAGAAGGGSGGGVGASGSSVAAAAAAPISVMVPVGVLKRQGSAKSGLNRAPKNVMFSDGIRPGCDLTELDHNWDQKRAGGTAADKSTAAGAAAGAVAAGTSSQQSSGSTSKSSSTSSTSTAKSAAVSKVAAGRPPIDPHTHSYIGKGLPPICEPDGPTGHRYVDVVNDAALLERLHGETLRFAVQRNLYVTVRIVHLTCCINKTVINYTSQGMHHVGQDEIIILLETDPTVDQQLPRDIFVHLNEIYMAADKGTTVGELGFSMAAGSTEPATTTNNNNNNDQTKSNHNTSTSEDIPTTSGPTTTTTTTAQSSPEAPPFLGHKEHGGFLHIRPTFQCLQSLNIPDNPFLIAILIHRWEVPWAKIFPLRLMLRLGALYRYYPCPHVSVRGRDSVYAEIAQTIINFLADFRTYSYTLAAVRGLRIHMEDRTTQVLIPRNRYDQVQKALANSSDHILALAGNFSMAADGHLVCIQNTESGCTETHSYSTQAVNIQGRPRRITGASFLVLNGALKSASGLSAKCSIVEDGLMVQVMPAKMAAVQKALRDMKDVDIVCGPLDGAAAQTEVVSVRWVENDVDFNIGVTSPIDGKSMSGVPSMRVHRGQDYNNANHIIRWSEVFLLQTDDETSHNKDPVDMSKLSEQIASSTGTALVDLLDLLVAGGQRKIGLRVTLHMDNVSYEAGSRATRLAPLYMNALDNELIPTLHRAATNLQPEQPIIVELVFHILDE